MIYDYHCTQCGAEQDNVYNTIAERRTNAPECCGDRMVIHHKVAPYGFVDREVFYECPVTGEGVTTRKQRNEIMAREGLMDANDFGKTFKQRADEKAKQDAEIAAIQAEVPKDLQAGFAKEEKTAKKKFMDSL